MSDEPTAEPIEVPPPLIPTSAAEWKRKARAKWLLTLPSGFVVKVRRVDWGRLLATGVVDIQVLTSMASSNPSSPADAVIAMYNLLPSARAVAQAIAVEPRIGVDEEDAIPFDDIDDTDLMVLFTWARIGPSAVPAAVEVME